MAGNLDSVLQRLGSPGRFHVLVFLLLASCYVPVSVNLVVMAFYAYMPPHACREEFFKQHSANRTEASIEGYEKEDRANVSVVIADVIKYKLGADQHSCVWSEHLEDTNTSLTHVCPAGHFVYGLEQGEATIVTQWDLVCEDRYKGHLATTLFYCGFMLGGLVAGFAADRLGRRPVLLVCLYVHAALGVAIAFSPNYIFFTVLRFVQGMFVQGLHTASLVMVAEMFQPRHRGLATPIMELFFGLGVLLTGAVAWLLGDWRHIQLAISASVFLSLAYSWFIPESLRYLVSQRNEKAVRKALERASRFNGISLECAKSAEDLCSSTATVRERRTSYSHLLATPNVRRRSMIIAFIWLVSNVTYFGLILESTELAGNRYHNYLIGASLEMAAFGVSIIFIKIFGRKTVLMSYFFLAAVCCVVAGVLPRRREGAVDLVAVTTGFAIAGRFFAAGLFSVLEMFSAELFPTVIRNMGIGASAFWGRVGAVISPQLLNLGQYTFRQLPVIIIGLLTLAGGAVTLALPETRGRPLPDTIQEIEITCPDYDLPEIKGDDATDPLDDLHQSIINTDGVKGERV